MDDRRFDAVTRAVGRRGLLGLSLGIVGLAILPPADAAAQTIACTRKQEGERCRGDNGCCSGRCQPTTRKRKRKGRCACSRLREPCFENFDCCARLTGANENVVCSSKDGFDEIVCCVAAGQCQSTADCCAEFICNGSGVCGPPS